MAAPREARDPYCACTMRRLNLDGTLTNTICDLCDQFVPDDKAIYVVLKDHVTYLRPLRDKRMVKQKTAKTTNDKRAIMDAIDSLPYREDIHNLFARYDCNVVCASIKVLVNNTSPELRSLLSSILENSPPAAERERVADEEVVWDTEPKPAPEKTLLYNYPCDPEIAAEEDQGIKDTEPEAIEEEYMDVPTMEEKPSDWEFLVGAEAPEKASAEIPEEEPAKASEEESSIEEAHMKGEPPTAEEYPEEVYKTTVKETKPPEIEEACEDCVYKEQNTICLPFSSQHKLIVHLQEVLEGACFAYGQRNLAGILRGRGWDCAEAVALHTWMNEFPAMTKTLDTKHRRELLQSGVDIQNIVAKRTRIDWSRMKKLLDDAFELTEILNVKGYSDTVQKVRLDIGLAVEGLSCKEQEAKELQDEELQRIAEERRKLDEWEVEVQN
ncbi:hypothetical protein ACHAO7_011260, partial [Fusarium culmorum]